MRGIPIFTFINKLDRQGKEPIELIEEIEEVLEIQAYPMNWPIGMGKEFLGIYDRFNRRIEQFRADESDRFFPLDEDGEFAVDHPMKETSITHKQWMIFLLLDEAGNEFSEEKIRRGELTPVFFGTALTNFGVQTFLRNIFTVCSITTTEINRR